MKKIGVLYSGGLDSAALIDHMLRKGYQVWPIYIHCGLPWEKTEIYWAQKFLRSIHHKNLHPLTFAELILENAYEHNWSKTGKTPGSYSRDIAVFLPARNLLLAIKCALALATKHVSQLALATLKNNPFPDASPAYFRLLEKILTASFRHPIFIRTPFRQKSKIEIIRQSAGAPLQLSFSCINPKERNHCGKCNKCAERRRAFKKAGVEDKTVYS